jgi:hypothetical protein
LIMPRHRYAFVDFLSGRIRQSSGRIMLPIRIVNPHNGAAWPTYGLLDTGATTCLFPGALASHLGHDLKGSGVKSSVTSGIEQKKIPTFLHTFRLELLSPDGARTVWQSKDVLTGRFFDNRSRGHGITLQSAA